MTIATIDKSNAPSVIDYLTQALQFLRSAETETDAQAAAAIKAEVVTAATATKELRLSKENQDLATELVRRAEWRLGRAIRKGQAEGVIKTGADGGPRGDYERNGKTVHVDPVVRNDSISKASPIDFASRDELYGNNAGIAHLAQAEPEEFDAALNEAKAEGNLSRANVVRKVKKQTGPTTRDQRADLIADLAAQGYSSRQMPAKVGVTEESVRQIARDYGIEIPADRSVGKTRRINSTQVVINTATALEGLVAGVELIDYADLDLSEARQWATSLTDSMRTLNRFAKQIKEMTQ